MPIQQSPDKRAYQLELDMASTMASQAGGIALAANVMGTAASLNTHLDKEPHIFFGRVVDCIAYARVWKVQVDRTNAIILCTDAVQGGMVPIGAHPFNTYPYGSGVIVLYQAHMTQGYILSAIPDFMVSAQHGLSDFVVQGSNVGLGVDNVHQYPTQLSQNGGISDFSAFRPFDGLNAGEWGAIAETGLGVFLDSHMAYLRVDEATGLFMWYRDQLLRLAGYNLQIRSVGREEEDLDDESEFTHRRAFATYVWEGRGAFSSDTDDHRDVDTETSQRVSPWLSTVEPAFDDQQPMQRVQEFNGYLGQGGLEFIHTLPAESPEEVARFQDELKYPGLFSQHRALHGRQCSVSAKGFIWAKRAIIPTPKMLKRPEDVTGDYHENYSAAGVYGVGPTPTPVDGWNPPDDLAQVSEFLTVAGILDELAYVYNFEGLHPFFYHTKDWYLPEQSELSDAKLIETPLFHNLSSDQFLRAPTPVALEIDHRYGNAFYFPNESYIAMLDDGGIAIGDGFGAEIRMTAGSVFIDSPGDVFTRAGRDVHAWAGADVILKAHRSADLTAANGDVRIKAENSAMILGGNNARGGVLIESKAACAAYDWTHAGECTTFGGVIIKARCSPVAIMSGDEILITTNVKQYRDLDSGAALDVFDPDAPDDPADYVGNKQITIDAGPHASISTYSEYFTRRLSEAAFDIWYKPDGDYVVNEAWATGATLGGNLQLGGNITTVGCIVSGDSIIGVNGVGSASSLTSDQQADLNDSIAAIGTRETAVQGYADANKQDGRDLLQPQNIFVSLRGACFTLRTASQYHTDVSFVMFESRWQQMARLTEQDLPTWDEPPVRADLYAAVDDVVTYPYPGRAPWVQEANFYMQDLTLYNAATGYDVDRGVPGESPYEDPAYGEVHVCALAGNYLVVRAPCN